MLSYIETNGMFLTVRTNQEIINDNILVSGTVSMSSKGPAQKSSIPVLLPHLQVSPQPFLARTKTLVWGGRFS